MREWRFVLSKKWLGYFGVAVVFAIVCVFLSHWQWERRHENQVVLDRLNDNYSAQPAALTALLPTLTHWSDSDEFRPVRVRGVYLTDKTYLVRNRSYNGFPGFDVLVPLQLSSGRVFIVDRGWVPTGNLHDAPDSIPSPPAGTVTVTARLAQSEALIKTRTDIPGTNEIAVINLPDVAHRLQVPTYTGAYGQLVRESPAVATLPMPALKPQVDVGLNLSYAIQWILFAVAAFAFFGYVIRREFDEINSDEEDQAWLAEARAYRRARRGPNDAEVEDDELDAAGYESSRPGTMIGR